MDRAPWTAPRTLHLGVVPDQSVAAAVQALADRVERRDGEPPLSDQALTRLTSAAVGHVLVQNPDGTVVGYGQRDGDSAEIVAEEQAVIAGVLDAAVAAGALPVRVWSHGRNSIVGAVLADRRFARVRDLHRLSRDTHDLPADAPLADGVAVRPFVPGQDEQAWLEVNAAAFAHHPEQGGWTLEDVLAREREPWFDPDGLLLADRDGRVLAAHWTKIHPSGAGEVYVLGVHPDAQGLGLGAALLTRGLHLLVARGCSELILYVDESNTTAMHLYERAGFLTADVDTQWELASDSA